MIKFSEIIGKPVNDIYLIDNHRSTPEIIDFANKINALNVNKIEKDLIASKPSGKEVVCRGFINQKVEYKYILDKIIEKHEAGTKYEDMAFIASNRNELFKMADLLTQNGIPSILLNPEPLLENSRVIAAIELAKFMQDPNATESCLVYLNCYLQGEILDKYSDDDINLLLESKKSEIEVIKALPDKVQCEKFFALLDELNSDDDEVFQNFIDTLKLYSNMSRIYDYCNNFEEYGSKQAFRRTHDYPGVVLTTAHSSKGLEWPIVFNTISKYDEEALHKKTLNCRTAVEEKRRLLFVSVTRAKDELYVTSTYAAFGPATDRTYNQFLIDCYHVLGQEFSIPAIIAEETAYKADENAMKKKKLDAQLKKAKKTA